MSLVNETVGSVPIHTKAIKPVAPTGAEEATLNWSGRVSRHF